MIDAKTWSDAERIIRENKIVLVGVFDSTNPMGRYISSLLDDISYYVEPAILVVKIDAASAERSPSLGDTLPRLRLYYKGEQIWEQIGFFFNPMSDKHAIRRGILYALRSRGLTPRSLGISLRF